MGLTYVTYQPSIAQWLFFKTKLYQSKDAGLRNQYQSSDVIAVQWSALLPDSEKQILKKYQQTKASTPLEYADSILLSLRASVDQDYSAAMMSTNSVDIFDNKAISIAGFIVPIDYSDDNHPRNIFVVPYFGACLHFPPPPPNQIVFAQLDNGFVDFELTQAYKLHGILSRGLFEDPLGTSAYVLDVVFIEPYFDNPDEFRQH